MLTVFIAHEENYLKTHFLASNKMLNNICHCNLVNLVQARITDDIIIVNRMYRCTQVYFVTRNKLIHYSLERVLCSIPCSKLDELNH